MPHEEIPQSPLVLVVDDFDDGRVMYAEFLSMSGMRVEEGRDGQEALDKAMATRPDVIVMDLSLPVLDGWEAIKRIRADETTRDIPIIALSGHSRGSTHEASAKAAGCSAFLTKPCLPDALLDCIKRVLVERTSSPT